MNPCKFDADYMNHHLSEEQVRIFEVHLSSCERCREKVYEWQTFERSLKKWAAVKKHSAPTSRDAQRLMERAQEPSLSWNFTRPLVLVTGPSALVLCVLAVWWIAFRGDVSTTPSVPDIPMPIVALVSEGATLKQVAIPQVEKEIAAPQATNFVATIGKDRVGVSPGGQIRVLEAKNQTVRLKLLKGSVACQVNPRDAGGRFVVEAGAYRVRVIGTKFKVTRDEQKGFSVMVESGKVEVSDAAGVHWYLGPNDVFEVAASGEVRPTEATSHELAALENLLTVKPSTPRTATSPSMKKTGQLAMLSPKVVSDAQDDKAAITAIASIPEKPKSKKVVTETGRAVRKEAPKATALSAGSGKVAHGDIALWREWVLSGKIKEARVVMERHVKKNPSDAKTWALLADCRRKEKSWKDAIDAYKMVKKHGHLKQAGHATFMMGTIYQKHLKNHTRAIEAFTAYKQSGAVANELRDLTDMHMARSMIALGRKAEAKTLLQSVIKNQKDSFVSSNAKKLLEKIE